MDFLNSWPVMIGMCCAVVGLFSAGVLLMAVLLRPKKNGRNRRR